MRAAAGAAWNIPRAPGPTLQHAPNLTRRASLIVLAKAVAFASTLALPLVIVRRMSPFEVGVFQQVALVIATLVTVLPLSVATSAYYFIPREPDRGPQVVLNVFSYSIAIALVASLLLIAYPGVLVFVLGNTAVAQYAPLLGVAVALFMLGSCGEPISLARQEMKAATAFVIGFSFSRGVLMTAAGLIFATVRSLLWALIVHGAILSAATIWYAARRYPAFWRSFDWPMARRQLRYAAPLGLAGILLYVEVDLHNYFVSHIDGTVAFAIYSYGTFEVPLTGILNEAVGSVAIPRMSVLQKLGDHREVVRLWSAVWRKMGAVLFPTAGLLLITSREFIVFLFTHRYEAAVPIFRVNLLLLPLAALVTDPVVRAYTSFHSALVRIRIAIFVMLVLGLRVATTRFGGLGAISVVVAARAIEVAVVVTGLARVVGVRRADLRLLNDPLKLILASAAAAATTGFLRTYLLAWRPFDILALCGAVYLAVYLAAVAALGVPTREECAIARRWLRAIPARLSRGIETAE